MTVLVPSSIPADCSRDVTADLTSWIASVPDGERLDFGLDGKCFRVDGTIELRGRKGLTFTGAATLRSTVVEANTAMWRLWDCSSILFADLTLRGAYTKSGTHDPSVQWAHGIDLRGSQVVMHYLKVQEMAGDAVYFGLGSGPSSGEVLLSKLDGTGRNGISVTAGDNVLVRYVTTDRIGFTAFDIEPNTGAGFGASRVTVDACSIGGYYLYAWAVIGAELCDDIRFTNTTLGRLRIAALYPTVRPKNLLVSGNRASTPQATPMEFHGVDGLTVTSNYVPTANTVMAAVDDCSVVSFGDNQWPGGTAETNLTVPTPTPPGKRRRKKR
jgi:hypothetical protein